MDRFGVSIKLLENGWADLLLSFNEHEMTFYFENVPSDALYHLLEGAIRIVGNIESTVVFPNGSERSYLSLKRLEDNLCRIEADGVHFVLSPKQFCKAIIRMFDTYAFHFSKDAYSANWNTFPERDIERLRLLYHTL